MLMKPVTEQQKASPSETCSVASNDTYSLMYLCQIYLHINQYIPWVLFAFCVLVQTMLSSQLLSKFMLQLRI